jgi:hypothetical protein
MSRTRPDRLLLVLAFLGLLAGLPGCTHEERPAPQPDSESVRDVVQGLSRTLAHRAAAVRRADVDAFSAGIGGGPAFREDQRVWFDNLTRLPVGRLAYRVDPGSLVRLEDAYWVTVSVSLQLAGYDPAPVVTADRYRFAPVPHRPGRWRLTSVTDADWEARHDVRSQPWDSGPVEVREGSGVLGIFDAGSVSDAAALLESVERGIAAVGAEVPYDWSRSVVVYALSDAAFLDTLEDVPGDDPGDLDAVAFPAGDGTRFVLNPTVLHRPGDERDRLVRHELTHVAVGPRDDTVPVWLAEGLAEYVSVRPLAPEDRRIPQAAVVAAENAADDLPDDATFNDDDSDAHYGLAWWAIEYVADAYGEDAPWLLLDAMAAPGADPARVLRDQFGTSTHALARGASRLILALYEPAEGMPQEG